VERLPPGNVTKSPWPGLREADSRRDLIIEATPYNKLALHPRLVDLIDWDPDKCVLTLEYIPNGNLSKYLSAHNDTITLTQRLCWIHEAAKGLQLLHSAKVIHSYVEPKNFLLDEALGLRIADFGGSSKIHEQRFAQGHGLHLPISIRIPHKLSKTTYSASGVQCTIS
jgi:serine/threonine protein kinase